MNKLTYADKLRKLQNMLFLTQASLAATLDVDRSQLTRWLKNKPISQENRDKIDKLYNQIFNTA